MEQNYKAINCDCGMVFKQELKIIIPNISSFRDVRGSPTCTKKTKKVKKDSLIYKMWSNVVTVHTG